MEPSNNSLTISFTATDPSLQSSYPYVLEMMETQCITIFVHVLKVVCLTIARFYLRYFQSHQVLGPEASFASNRI